MDHEPPLYFGEIVGLPVDVAKQQMYCCGHHNHFKYHVKCLSENTDCPVQVKEYCDMSH